MSREYEIVYVILSPEMRAALHSHRQRTGIGPYKLISNADNCPPGLTGPMVNNWLAGTTNRVNPAHCAFVLETWERLPSLPRHKRDLILSPQHIAELKKHKERTGTGVRVLLSTAGPLPAGLTERVVNNWIFGGARTKRTRREYYTFVLKAWKRLPTNPYVPVTAPVLELLLHHRQRTGIGPQALLSRGINVPEGLAASTVENWLSGAASQARQQYLDFVKRAWAALPDDPDANTNRVTITKSVLEELRCHRRETGIGPSALLRGASDKPEGLNSNMILKWLTEEMTSAPEDCLAYVLERWRRADRRVPLTDAMIAELNDLRDKTGMGAVALLKDADNRPPRLTVGLLSHMLAGRTETVSEPLYAFVLERWRSLDQQGVRKTGIALDAKKRNILKREQQRTGIGVRALLSHADALPEGLTETMITDWLTSQVQYVQREHFDFVRDLWRKIPDPPSRSDDGADPDRNRPVPDLLSARLPKPRQRTPTRRVPSYAGLEYSRISDELYEHFHAEIRRTRVSPKRLLQSRTDCPKGLTTKLVSDWLRGEIQSAERRYLDYLHFHYGLLPDASQD